MAKNRRHQSAAIRFGPAVKAFFLCLLIGGSGVGYVWQKNQIYELGRERKKREVRLAELQEQNLALRKRLNYMHSPQFLEAQVRELKLGLVPPPPSAVWRLKEPHPALTARERQYAAQPSPPPELRD